MKNSVAEPFCFKPLTVLSRPLCDVQEAVSVDADQPAFRMPVSTVIVANLVDAQTSFAAS